MICWQRARYFCAASVNDVKYMRHYALNVPLYTHFTSPIRRYADVMVHRLLAALLKYCEEPKWTVDYVNRYSNFVLKSELISQFT